MLKFKQFISEYLNDNQRERVNSWLPDKESGRIYSPKAEQISGHIIPEGQHSITIPAVAHTMRAVHSHLDTHGYTNHDYASGTTTDNHGRQVSIGKALEKTKAPDQLKNDYANDDRENAKDLEKHDIVISRHPYHVAEASTNKPWKSCAGLTKSGGFCRYGGGAAARVLKNEIEEGTHVAYLVPKLKKGEESSNSFPDIQKRIDKAKGRIYLKPHSSKSGHTVLSPEDKVYQKEGKGKNLGFLRSVQQFSSTAFPMKNGEIYHKNNNVYDDDGSSGTPKFNTSDESVDKIMKSDDLNARHYLRTSKHLNSDQLHKLIDYHDDPVHDKYALTDLARNPNIRKPHIDKLLNRNIPEVNNALAFYPKLHRSHIDHLINTGDSNTHLNLINNSNKDLLTKDHLHSIIDKALESENADTEKGEARKLTPEKMQNIYNSNNHGNILKWVINHSSIDSSHIDKLMKSNNPALHGALIAKDKLSDDHLKHIRDKWQDVDLPHLWQHPSERADNFLAHRNS